MNKLYVIDASGYIYRSYFAIRNMTNSQGQSTNALFGFIRSLLKLQKDFNPKHLACIFDGPNNGKSRVEIYSDYKAHRASMPPDLLYQIEWSRKFCDLMGIPMLNIPEVEADDTMGSVAKWASAKGVDVYLCTSDKDMAQLVGENVFILNTHKENQLIGKVEVEEIYGVPPQQIVDLLAMTGDTSDNVPGLSGFGPKTAALLLKQFGSLDYILNHPEEIPGQKKQETIRQEKEKALLSRQLVTIDTNVNFPHEVDFFAKKFPDTKFLKEFYSSMGFNSLIKDLEPFQELQGVAPEQEEILDYRLVLDESTLKTLLDTLYSRQEVCFEILGTDSHAQKSTIVGISFSTEPKKAFYLPLNGSLNVQKTWEQLKALFENPLIKFYGQNLKYAYLVLKNCQIHLANISFDVGLASYILNSHSRQHSLEQLFLDYFGKVKMPLNELVGKGKNQINLSDVPLERIFPYACEDADYLLRLKIELETLLQKRKLAELYYGLELPLLKVLAKMERRGIFINQQYLLDFSKELNGELQVLQQEIYAMAGEVFNLNSPKQLSEILFTKLAIKAPRKTATGLSTNAEVLESLKNQYPICSKILEYRSLEKLRSTYVETLPLQVQPKTQRIHCTFNQSVAATGRLSCQDPNLQNIPVRTEVGRKIRESFCPQNKTWSYLAADYSQIELRLLAHLSEDPTLIKAFDHNEDIHRYTASLIFNISLDEVTSEMRYQAKAVNFGIVYGQQAFGLAQELGIDVKEAALFIDTYFKRYPRVKEFLESSKDQARLTSKAITMTGRERAIPEITSKNGLIRSAAERLAVNTPIQGTAADLIKMAMLKIDRALDEEHYHAFMILQIHDELIFEVPDFELLNIENLVRQCMQNVMKLKVPLVVDINIGKNWKEC